MEVSLLVNDLQCSVDPGEDQGFIFFYNSAFVEVCGGNQSLLFLFICVSVIYLQILFYPQLSVSSVVCFIL